MTTAATDERDDAPPAITQNPNPLGTQQASTAAVAIERQRAVSEVQAAMVIARQFPRDPVLATDRIMQAFMRPTLAATAMYAYARGGSDITGPSIRAAEAIAQAWGNFQFGVRELEQRPGESTVEAFAWDVETNARATKLFQVAHIRSTKKGSYRIEDPRDVYELVANSGARRMRACILSLIPGDVVEAAIKQAETTLRTRVEITPERLASMVEKFGEHGVTRQMLEARIQRRLEAITPALMVNLGKIINSLHDGMSVANDWFDVPAPPADDDGGSRAAQIKERLRQNGTADAPAPAAAPATTAAAPGPELSQEERCVEEITGAAKARGISAARLAKVIKDATGQEQILPAFFDAIMVAVEQFPLKAAPAS
jgi:hypothetical protein